MYAGLIAGGAGWGAIVRSVHRFGPAVSLTAKALHPGSGPAIYARHGGGLCELDGQMLLALGEAPTTPRRCSWQAEAAEAAGRHAEAAALFGRCLGIDPAIRWRRSTARTVCARRGGRRRREHELTRALTLDPGFVEAWFNLAGVMAERGRVARRAGTVRAIELDAGYADAVSTSRRWISRPAISPRHGGGGSATWSSTPSRNGRAPRRGPAVPGLAAARDAASGAPPR